jgi:hypothetical protein
MNILQVIDSPVTIILAFLVAAAAAYITVQSFIKIELEGNENPRLHAFTAVLCSVSFLGTFVILGFIIGHFA